MTVFQNPLVLLVVAAVIAVAGGVVGRLTATRGRHRARSETGPADHSIAEKAKVDGRSALRAAALDSLADAVLITERDGRIRDCNSSALTLFDRHRGEVEEQFASALRRFDGLDQGEPYRAASDHAVWIGEGWARQPDGGMKLCQVRVMAMRDERARIIAFAESFRDVAQSRDLDQDVRDLLYGVRAVETSASANDRAGAAREDLRLLSEGFRDLDHVLRQYERLLPSLGADDPLTESIAGVAHDARAAVAAVGVNSLLEDIPRALARLRSHLQAFSADSASGDGESVVSGRSQDRRG